MALARSAARDTLSAFVSASRPSLGAMARCHSFVTEDASRHDSERAGLLYALRSARQHDLLLSPSAYGGAEYSAA